MVLGFLVGWWVCEHELIVKSGGGFGPPVTIGLPMGISRLVLGISIEVWSEGYFRPSKKLFPCVQVIVSHVSIFF